MTAVTLQQGWARLRAGERGHLLLILLFALLLPLANPRVYATDEVQYYVYLRSLRFDGDLDFANDYAQFARLNPSAGVERSLLMPDRIQPTGRYSNIAPVGAAIMWAPFFLLADALVHLANALGARIPADGFSAPYIYAVCYASALYGLLGLLLCYRLARRYTSQFAATLASVTIWLATPLVWYMFIQMPFAHATAFFLTALFLTIWQNTREQRTKNQEQRTKNQEQRTKNHPEGTRPKNRNQEPRMADGGSRMEKLDRPSSIFYPLSSRGWRAWAALGLAGALMTMTREQLGLFLLIPAIEALVHYWRIIRPAANQIEDRGSRIEDRSADVSREQSTIFNPLFSSEKERETRSEENISHASGRLSSILHLPSSTLPVLGSRFSVLGLLFARHLLFLAVFLVALAPQLAAYQVLNGRLRPAGEVSGKFNLCSPHMIDTLIDYDPRPSARCHVVDDPVDRAPEKYPPFAHGALIWSPVLVPALLGLVLLARRRDPFLALALALAFLAQTYLNGAFGSTWHLTGSFGFRRLIECTPIFIIGLALLVDWAAARIDRRWLLVPALLLIAWNAGLVLNASFFNAETRLREGMRWPDLWGWQFDTPRKVLARAGDLLFNRCRFLKNGGCS